VRQQRPNEFYLSCNLLASQTGIAILPYLFTQALSAYNELRQAADQLVRAGYFTAEDAEGRRG